MKCDAMRWAMMVLIGAVLVAGCYVYVDVPLARWAHQHQLRQYGLFHGLQALADGLVLLAPAALLVVGVVWAGAALALLLLLAVRKQELTAARWAEFDLDRAVWHLPGERTKTGSDLDIPLPGAAVACLRELHRLAMGSEWLLPARKAQDRMLPHIHENTLNVALSKVKALLSDLEPFCIHDFRRTARTRLAALGVDPHIAERCLNHKIKGIEGIYNRHDYFEERRHALELWGNFLETCESGANWTVVPLRRAG